jgi:hypothetical protein
MPRKYPQHANHPISVRFKVSEYINKTLGKIRLKGNTVQCFRKTGELGSTGRDLESVVVTLDRWADELSPKALEILTKEEQAQWRRWKDKHDEKYRREQLALALNAAPGAINAAAQALREKAAKPADTAALWQAIDSLILALKKTERRPPKPRGRPPLESDDTELWPLGDKPPLPNFAPPGTDAHRQYQALLDEFEAYRRKMDE